MVVEDKEMPLEEHLEELRRRLLISLAAVLLLSVVIATLFGSRLLNLIIQQFLPAGVKVIAKSPVEYAYTWFLVVLFLALYLALPVVIYEAFKFAEPGLYPNERRFIVRVVPTSFILFTLGVLFSFFILIPFSSRFLISYSETAAEPMLSLHRFVSFVGFMLLSVGVIFQLPLILTFMVKSGLVSHEQLRSKRKYIYIAFFAISMAITPDPTPAAPLAVAAVFVAIFELSLLLSRYLI